MKRVFYNFIAVFFLLCPPQVFATQIRNLTILAEPNMVGALTAISRIYSQKNAVVVSVSFGTASDLINDIDTGEPADIFISGHLTWIGSLKQKGLVDIYNISHIASDQLVLVTSQNNFNMPRQFLEKPLDLENALKILDDSRLVLIVDSEDTSLGQHTASLLSRLRLGNIQVFKKLDEDRTSVAGLINNNPDNYTLLLASQVKGRKGLRVLTSTRAENVFYQALVIAGDNMENAREFMRFLRQPLARGILKDNGFVIN